MDGLLRWLCRSKRCLDKNPASQTVFSSHIITVWDAIPWLEPACYVQNRTLIVHRHLDFYALLRMLRNPLALHWTLLPLVG
jgi:hypothetical protein